jgi:PEP-CTERM motif
MKELNSLPFGPAGIYAYDSSNALIGQSVMSSGGILAPLSLTTSSPISYIQLQGSGAGEYSIDNFSFTRASAVPEPTSLALLGISLLVGIAMRRKLQSSLFWVKRTRIA